MPIPRGGGIRLVEALAELIEEAGGTLETGRDVERGSSSASGRAEGVRTTDGELVRARRAVLANVTPTQLYGRLLPEADTARARSREPLPLRPLPTCRSTTRSRSRRAGRATSASAARRWCT